MQILAIFFAKYVIYLLIAASILFLLKQKRSTQKEILIFALISLPLSLLIAKILGHFYYNPRPFVAGHFTPLISHAANNGFPSDHALFAFTISAIVFCFNKKWGVFLGALGLLVSLGRIYVGIHSAIDILGSFVISVSVYFIVWKFIVEKTAGKILKI